MKAIAGIFCAILGYVIGHYLLDGPPAVYASMLISYHLYLVFLVMLINRQKGMSLPFGPTFITHLAFLAVLIGLPYMRRHIPFFFVIQYCIPGLAVFEADWLFSGGGKKAMFDVSTTHAPMPDCTAEDYDEFLAYLSQQKRAFFKPGRSVREEHVLWMADKLKKEAEAAARQAEAAARQAAAPPASQIPQ
jgi:hypothetical protein